MNTYNCLHSVGLLIMTAVTEYKKLIKITAKKLKGHERRDFTAEVAERLCNSSPRQIEMEFGFGRKTVEAGLHERRTGMICYGDYATSGRNGPESSSRRTQFLSRLVVFSKKTGLTIPPDPVSF